MRPQRILSDIVDKPEHYGGLPWRKDDPWIEFRNRKANPIAQNNRRGCIDIGRGRVEHTCKIDVPLLLIIRNDYFLDRVRDSSCGYRKITGSTKDVMYVSMDMVA